MENYSYTSYPESGDSSPRSREIDFENPPPWEDPNQPPPNYRVKFMCSYGGKIHPRPHDNQLSYLGGETKILAVERSVKFSSLISKLASLCDADNVSFKYQLPGEDLDALISVTNDDDLEHMMHEYDRLYRASPKPARLRLFLFPLNPPSAPVVAQSRSFGSDDTRSEKERFVEALNSGPIQPPPAPSVMPPPPGNADFLFGSEKGMAPPIPGKLRDPIAESAVRDPELPVPGIDDRMIGSDPIQKHIQDLQRLHIEDQQGMYRRKSDDNLAGGYPGGDYYVQRLPEKVAPVTVPGTMHTPVGYWPEKQVTGGVLPGSSLGPEQQVFMIPTPAGAYHAPLARPMTGPGGQTYYAVPRMPPEMYRDQQLYNVMPSVSPAVPSVAAAQPSLAPQAAQKVAGYSEGYGMLKQAPAGGVTLTEAGYAQVAYDSTGRPIYYPAPGGVMGKPSPAPSAVVQPQYQAMGAPAVSADMRPAGSFNQEAGGNVVSKVTQASV